MNVIEFENVAKQYRLGVINTRTLREDIQRFWIMHILGKEDPNLKLGEKNDRTKSGNSKFVWALRNINLKVEKGDILGIIGKNGSGKSTLLKLLSRITIPTTGIIRIRGNVGSLIEVGTGFHPEMTGRENIFLNGAILGMRRADIKNKIDEIIDFSGCARYIDTPIKRYSSGMVVRLGFAVAAFLEPDILIVDEVLSVGDAEFQKIAIEKMKSLNYQKGKTILFVSHSMSNITQFCNKCILLEHGEIKQEGYPKEVVENYLSNAFRLQQKFDLDTPPSAINAVSYVRFYNADGEQIKELESNQRLFISVGISNCKYTHGLGIGLYFKNTRGERILGTTSFIHPLHVNIKNDSPDRIFTITIPKLCLTEGIYYIDVELSIRNCKKLCYRENIGPIKVLMANQETGNFLGYSYIDASWSLQ